MSTPDPQIIRSLFEKTLVEYFDAIDTLTDMLIGGEMDEAVLGERVLLVDRKRQKLITTIQSARYHHGTDFGLYVPPLYMNGGIA